MRTYRIARLVVTGLLVVAGASRILGAATVSGELKQWHKVTLTFDGPSTSQTATPNPFTEYRLNVTFTQGQTSMIVPGYYATDGNGGASGNKWRVHFAPPSTGTWTYTASFRTGTAVNVSLEATDGSPTSFDGETGNIEITASDKTGRDFRSPDKGLIKNRGHHYLTYASGNPWVKGGPDIPENWLAHSFSAHGGQKGALDFIAGKGANSIYFLPMNINGDGNDTWPTISKTDKTRYDNSKCAQWEDVFAHAQSKGIFLHFVLAETENGCENYHDNGELGVERKLYYRELFARFGHHNGLEMNIGEENDYGTTKREQFAAFMKAIDPYDHPVTTHTHSGQYSNFYTPLLGNGDFDITSFQGGSSGTNMFDLIVSWREQSATAGVPWAISFDEPQKIENDKTDYSAGYAYGRRKKMWPCYMGGGAGFEWYVQQDGGGHGFDQAIDDYNDMDVALEWTGYALDFLGQLPLMSMEPDRSLGGASSGDVYVLAEAGEVYAMYNDESGSGFTLDLTGVTGSFDVKWFDPRNGGALQDGSVTSVDGGSEVSLGNAPDTPDRDWAVLVTRTGGPSGVRAVISATPLSGDAPLTVKFDGTGSTGDNLTYLWNFGDEASSSNTATTDTATHTYQSRGTYAATLTVSDGSVSRTSSVSVVIAGLRPADNVGSSQSGLEYAYYEGTWSSLPNFDNLTAASSGTVTNFDISQFSANSYGVVFTGFVEVPESGQYTFFTASNDGTKLYIGDEVVVNNDGQHTVQEQSGTIGLASGKHAIRVEYFQNGGSQELTVSYQGPGVSSKTAIPDASLSHGQITHVFLPRTSRDITAAHDAILFNVRGRVIGRANNPGSLPSGHPAGILILKDKTGIRKAVRQLHAK